MALVLKKWYASKTANADGNFVHLIGRVPGFIAWLLAAVGIDPTTDIEIKERIIIFTTGSLAGMQKRVIPMKSVCSAYYGYKKPWKQALIIGLLLAVLLGAIKPLFGIVGVIVGIVYYYLNRELTVGIVELSGWLGGFAFKRSVIEGKDIDEKKAYEVIDIVRSLIETKTV